MKRNPDLIRQIAFATESLAPGAYLSGLEGVDAHTFAAHVSWMRDADLVDARVQSYVDNSAPAAVVLRMTWAGCDFLDAARSDTLWAKAKKSVIAPTASWTFDILKDWLKEEIKQGLPTLRSLT